MADIEAALAEQVVDACARQRALRIVGGNSKAFYGHPVTGETLEMAAHNGIVSYEPTELVVTARAGTPLAEIEDALARNGQMLSFEPPRFGGNPTIGGVVATGLAGPRRPWGGAPRDVLLGTRILDGRGRVLNFGGQVMKNVAGYDVSRLMAGAQGTLGVLLAVSLKVLPAPEKSLTLSLEADRETAVARMRELALTAAPIDGACHIGDRLVLRLSGNGASVDGWQNRIGGDTGERNETFWKDLRDLELGFFGRDQALWRLSLPPATHRLDCEEDVLTDWGGAQRWVYSSADHATIRDEVAKSGGHAILFRHGTEDSPPRFHPVDSVIAQFSAGLRKEFDPAGILNPGRLG